MKKKSRNKSKPAERPVHYFTKEYLESVKDATPTQIVRYLEESKRIYYAGLKDNAEKQEASTLINIRIPTDLLDAFKATAELHNTKYQTLIKKLMRDYIGGK
jgi:predicted DNA binding CopG/RHH family protein